MRPCRVLKSTSSISTGCPCHAIHRHMPWSSPCRSTRRDSSRGRDPAPHPFRANFRRARHRGAWCAPPRRRRRSPLARTPPKRERARQPMAVAAPLRAVPDLRSSRARGSAWSGRGCVRRTRLAAAPGRREGAARRPRRARGLREDRAAAAVGRRGRPAVRVAVGRGGRPRPRPAPRRRRRPRRRARRSSCSTTPTSSSDRAALDVLRGLIECTAPGLAARPRLARRRGPARPRPRDRPRHRARARPISR